jgi:hypothetical protein
MKLCPVCAAEVLDNFDLCWKCLNEFDAKGQTRVETETDFHLENDPNNPNSDTQKILNVFDVASRFNLFVR